MRGADWSRLVFDRAARVPQLAHVLSNGLGDFPGLLRPDTADRFAERIVSSHQQVTQFTEADLVLPPAHRGIIFNDAFDYARLA